MVGLVPVSSAGAGRVAGSRGRAGHGHLVTDAAGDVKAVAVVLPRGGVAGVGVQRMPVVDRLGPAAGPRDRRELAGHAGACGRRSLDRGPDPGARAVAVRLRGRVRRERVQGEALALVSTVAPPTLAVFSVLAVDAGAPVWAGLELAGADELPELPHPAAITPATAIPAGASHFLFIAVSIRCGILRYLDRVLPAAGWWLTLRGAPAPGRSPGSGGRMRRRSPGCLPAARARMPGTTWPARRQWSSLLLWLPARAC